MSTLRIADVFRRIDAFEHAWCLRLNRGCRRDTVRQVFAIISRLGDGVFWYSLTALLPIVYGQQGLFAAARMFVVGMVGLALYKWLKARLIRERPCVSLIGIVRGTTPLDRYSFPSGHTLHAVSFSILLTASFPELAWLCVPFAILVAVSRVVLGLHYPSDVFAGAVIGAALAWLGLLLAPLG
jgi:undecaprenyl-diphosphatase